MRTTLTVDDDIYEAVNHISKVSGERVGKVLSRLARKGLNPEAPAKPRSGRFPTFDVPADAPIISAERVQRILDEEGLI